MRKEVLFVLYASIFIFLLMLLLNFMFKIASVFRLGIPLLYALFVSILFPDFVREHEMLANGILIALLALVLLSWVVTIRKKIRRRREQKQYRA